MEHPTVVQYVLKLLDRFHETKEVVEANMQKAQLKAKLYYDRGARSRKFEVGDQVMLLRVSKKTSWKCSGKAQPKCSKSSLTQLTLLNREGR